MQVGKRFFFVKKFLECHRTFTIAFLEEGIKAADFEVGVNTGVGLNKVIG